METQNKTAVVYARISIDKQTVDMKLNEPGELVAGQSRTLHSEYIRKSL